MWQSPCIPIVLSLVIASRLQRRGNQFLLWVLLTATGLPTLAVTSVFDCRCEDGCAVHGNLMRAERVSAPTVNGRRDTRPRVSADTAGAVSLRTHSF